MDKLEAIELSTGELSKEFKVDTNSNVHQILIPKGQKIQVEVHHPLAEEWHSYEESDFSQTVNTFLGCYDQIKVTASTPLKIYYSGWN